MTHLWTTRLRVYPFQDTFPCAPGYADYSKLFLGIIHCCLTVTAGFIEFSLLLPLLFSDLSCGKAIASFLAEPYLSGTWGAVFQPVG